LFLGNLPRLAELLQSLHRAHDFLGRGVQLQCHARPFFPEELPPTLSVRIADVVGLGALPAKARTFWSKLAVMAGADCPASTPTSASNRSFAVTLVLRVEGFAHAVSIEGQRVARTQAQFRALEVKAGFEAQRRAKMLDRPA